MKKIGLFVTLFSALHFASNAQDTTGKKMMDTAYAEYIGTYKFPDGSPVDEVEIAWQDTSLTITSDQGTATMSSLGVDSFSMSEYNGTIAFKRGGDEKVNMIDIYVMGMTLEGTKQPAAPGGTALRKEDFIDNKKSMAVSR